MNLQKIILCLLLGGGFCFAGIMGRIRYRAHSTWNALDRWIAAITPLLLFTFIALLFFKVYSVVLDEHSWIRFEKTWVLALGYPLYTGQDSGPAMATIYGPVSVLFYLPATLTHDPMLSLRIAQALAILIFFLPVFWLHGEKKSEDPRLSNFSFLTFLCFGSMAIHLTSIRQGVFIVHADAPTLGLAAFSCGWIYFRKKAESWSHLLLSAFFAVLAVWSKQVAIPLLPAIVFYLWIADGWRVAQRYLFCLILNAVLVSAVFFACFDAKLMIFNMVTVPSQHPLRDKLLSQALKTFFRITREWLVILLWGMFSMVPLIVSKTRPESIRAWFKMNRWVLFILVGLAMMPLSMLANLKVGGSNNALSHTNYYILIASTLAFLTGQKEKCYQNARWVAYSGKIAVLALAVLLTSVNLPTMFYRFATLDKKPNFAKEAYEFIKANPGKSYFPRLTLLHLLAEGKLYHTADGLMDRHWANMPVSKEHLLKYIPDINKLEFIAFQGEDHKWLLPLDGFPVGEKGTAELPHFTVYRRHSNESATGVKI